MSFSLRSVVKPILYRVGPEDKLPRPPQELPAQAIGPCTRLRRIGNRHQGNARAIKCTSPLGGTGLRLLLTGLVMARTVFSRDCAHNPAGSGVHWFWVGVRVMGWVR